MPPARHGAPAPGEGPSAKACSGSRPSAQGRGITGWPCRVLGPTPHLCPHGSPDTPWRVAAPRLAPSLLWPCYHHMPSSGCPLTRGFGDLFREDEPQRERMGHGLHDRLSGVQGWFPSIFSISTACTTAAHWLQRGQVPKFLLSKNSPGICLSVGTTSGGHGMPSARNSCHRHFQLRLDNETRVAR